MVNELEIKYIKTTELVPYANNTRTHDDKQVTQIASSIREFGFTNPVLVDEKQNIIAGHGRIMAAKKLKMDEVPCVVLEGLTDAQRKAYIIADNKLALNAGWDEDLLKIEIEGLSELDFDLSLLGFDDNELSLILDEVKENEMIDLSDSISETFEVVIELGDEMEQESIYSRLIEEGFKCRVLTL